MQYFDFEYLIEKYSTEFTVSVPSAGEYDDSGDWVEGTPSKVTLTGAIISHRQSKIFKSQGALTEQDRALYMLNPLDKALHGAKLYYEDKEYRIGDMLENAAFTGVYAYTLKYVSTFQRGESV